MTQKQQLAAEYLAKFPSISKHSIAAKLYNDHEHIFNSVEHARTAIRGVSSACGKKSSKYIKITHTPDLPPSKMQNRAFVDLPTSSNNILWLSDIHIPNQDNDAIKLAIDALNDAELEL